jgi:hypothetical protein
MKHFVISKRVACLTVAALGLWLGASPSQAATIVTDPGYAPGIGYEWGVTMSQNDSATIDTGSVGAKSWAEPGNPVGGKGWTHTSDWVALDLSSLTENTLLTVTHSRGTTGNLFPAFSIYQGWEQVGPETHQFNNVANTSWAANLSYLNHEANAGGPNGTDNGTGTTSVSQSYSLAPGLYSIALGGNPSFDLGQTGTHAFVATLTTAPVPVPAAVYLFGSGLIGLAGLARRRMKA